MRKLAVVLAAVLGGTSQLYAQERGTFEIGGFPTIAYFDRTLHLNQASVGPGLRLGYFLTDQIALEADGSWVPTTAPNDVDVKYMPFHARLMYNFISGKGTDFHIGAGYSYSRFRDGIQVSDHGPGASAGVRLGTGGLVSIRIDAYVDYIPSPDNGAPENWHWGIQPGLTFMPNWRRGPRDADRDGIVDEADACGDTPAGDRVDARGCTVRDSDSDGVFDEADACPDTPAGERVDPKGCPLPKDADADGVADPTDACPDTPKGTKVDPKGCPPDSDGDGVSDDLDACADTPQGTKVDAKGCPLDSDSDRVSDTADKCPNTAAGLEVDADGCQVLIGVNFETGKAVLTPESAAILDRVAQSLVARDTVRVEVVGHTDSTGSISVNRRLSTARAEAVRKYLVSQGVSEDRLTARGAGPDEPLASNDTAEGRAQNRRVELRRTN
jgi:outer membrane protein OmpA-like peptidoglycan-associated protein